MSSTVKVIKKTLEGKPHSMKLSSIYGCPGCDTQIIRSVNYPIYDKETMQEAMINAGKVVEGEDYIILY